MEARSKSVPRRSARNPLHQQRHQIDGQEVHSQGDAHKYCPLIDAWEADESIHLSALAKVRSRGGRSADRRLIRALRPHRLQLSELFGLFKVQHMRLNKVMTKDPVLVEVFRPLATQARKRAKSEGSKAELCDKYRRRPQDEQSIFNDSDAQRKEFAKKEE